MLKKLIYALYKITIVLILLILLPIATVAEFISGIANWLIDGIINKDIKDIESHV